MTLTQDTHLAPQLVHLRERTVYDREEQRKVHVVQTVINALLRDVAVRPQHLPQAGGVAHYPVAHINFT